MQGHFEHCAALVRERDHDGYLAALFAPAGRRDALFALYAYSAEISRIRELAREPMPGEIRLQWWREVLLGERVGEAAAHPVACALMETVSRHNLARERLVALIEAHRFDIYDEPMVSLAELQAYALATSGTIYECAARILAGPETILADVFAEAGQAETIADLIERLPRHAAHHQLYMPLEILRHYGAEPADVYAMRATPELRASLAELRLRARRHLSQVANAGISEIARPAFLALAPLRQWLLMMERNDYDPFHPPLVPQWRRQWRIWRAAKSLRRIGD
jgi:15-cis-phytoene synthase